MGYSPWRCEESEITERLTLSFHFLVGWGEVEGGRGETETEKKIKERDNKKILSRKT